MRYKKNIASSALAHILSIIFGFISSILIARGLGAANQGQFSFYVLIFGLIATYGHFGLTTSISYFIKKTNYDKDDVVNTNLSSLLLLGIFYFVVIFLLKNIIFEDQVLWLLLIWTIYFSSLLISTCVMNVYVANEEIYIYNRLIYFVVILKTVIILLLYILKVINIYTVSVVYMSLEIIKLVYMHKRLGVKFRFHINKSLLIGELKFGIPLYLSGLFLYLNYRIDQLMIKYYYDKAALGVYALSVTLAELAKTVPDSVVSAFTGRLYNCKESEKKKIVIKTIKLSFYMTVIISIIGMICKPLITILYGMEFSGAGLSMIILLIGIPFLTIGKVSAVYFFTNGKTKIHMRIAFFVLVVNLIANLLLIPKYNIYGAAIASSISYIFYAIVYLIILGKYKIDPREIMIIHKGDLLLVKEYLLNIKKKIKKGNDVNS